jgi:hypothetical protein
MKGYTIQDAENSVGIGWWPLLEELYQKMPKGVIVTQVKEKFGTLRFYYDGGDKEFDSWVGEAEKASAFVCEDCGRIGKLVSKNGWYRTLCSNCAEFQHYGD